MVSVLNKVMLEDVRSQTSLHRVLRHVLHRVFPTDRVQTSCESKESREAELVCTNLPDMP